MINWNFDSNDYTEQSFKPIPVGDHRVRIAEAVEQTSQAGNPMIKLVLNVSGYNSTIWHFIVLNPEKKEITNQRLGELFNSFGIQQGNFNLQSWVGKVGAAKVKHEDYKGEPSAKIAYFINKDRQDKLPAWQDGNNSGNASATGFVPVAEDIDLPFN
jgi:hypothetical protein